MKHVPASTGEVLRREIAYGDPALLLRRFARQKDLTFLDSALPQGELGRYSYIAADPFETFTLAEGEGGLAALARLDRRLKRWSLPRAPELPPFQGGFAGYIAYEFARLLEPQIMARTPPPDIAPILLHAYDTVVAFDHQARRCWIVSTGFPETDPEERIRRAERRIAEIENLCLTPEPALAGDYVIASWRSNFTRADYEAAIQRTIDYILAGDIFQANIAQRFDAEIPPGFDPLAFYLNLRKLNPATFGAFLDYGAVKVASSSPERLVSFDGETAEARPIKGTRRRDANASIDAELKAELLASRKDRAENVMIVDLLRNDLSRVAEPGTVQVPVLCGLESYASVHHLTSVVTGRLAAGKSRGDLIAACFPGGSITGAPKMRAQEIIAEIERVPRNVYCGSIGFLSFTGEMDLNIAIRTVLFHEGRAEFQGGGGITAKSHPADEYEETLAKVARIARSFERRDAT
ncbi:aminodeoxychorismate synthase component I [Nordella sp. HKS 07]|uniref:aminodeoxychorismate synthase component I n=1 Tax=Nordella sp. HKS 07 TaxID=2712222 RepID=UPI0013E1170B|nr:aminodeoxychorismate synthase component I [Nordella sp. HKS 07]QIG47941.1 aminodeoxychorismate synthase component I [Nordella sp. HKS 07]